MKPFDPSTESANKTFDETNYDDLLTENTLPNIPKRTWFWKVCSKLGLNSNRSITPEDLKNAIRSLDKDEVMRILESSFDLKNHNEIPWLSLAARRESRTIMDLLIMHGADINAVDDSLAGKMRTPLHEVVKRNWEKGLRLLLDNGASLEIKDKNGQTPLEMAIQRESVLAVRFLLEAGASLNNSQGEPLPLLGWVRSVEVLSLLISAGVDLTLGDEGGPFLHSQLKLGNVDIVKQMLFHNVNPNILDKKGRTPAFYLGYLKDNTAKECLEKLMKSGLDLSIVDLEGNLAAHFIAKMSSDKELLKYVFRFYPDAALVANENNETPLMYLKEKGLEGLLNQEAA